MTSEELLTLLSALDHPQRLRVIEALAAGPIHVSELARRLGLSRPLLYLHLDRLEKAGLVDGSLELSDNGRAMKYLTLTPFDIHLTTQNVVEAVRADDSATDLSKATPAKKKKPTAREKE